MQAMRVPRKKKLDELNILKPYNQADAEILIVTNYVVARFLKLKTGFVRNEKKLYDDIHEMFEDIYFLVIDRYSEIYKFYADEVRGVKDKVLKFLRNSNPVTKYVFQKELDRKRAYLIEALLAEDVDIQREITRAAIRLNKMIKEFAVQIADKATLEKYKKDGFKKVKWQVMDVNACDKCKELKDKIFNIEDLPIKPHINCRCWVMPYGQIKQTD